MIGTGVFTSLGFQLVNIQSVFSILLLWVLGGIISLCGAFVYAELGVTFPKSGGEYVYLSKLIHPFVGFLSGWVSSTVGFAAPVALAALALAKYINIVFPVLNFTACALTVVACVTLIHASNLKSGSQFQKIVTVFKVVIILFFIVAGFFVSVPQPISLLPQPNSTTEIFSKHFWISLIYVLYAYSGWNAASYLAGDMRNVKKDLPKSLILGTLIVTVIYVLLNFVFLYTAPINQLAGVVEVGHVSANAIFGNWFGNIMSLGVAFLLISSISAMIMAGPRIIKSMGEDITKLNFLSKTNKNNVPYVAVTFQSLVTVLLILFLPFEKILMLVGLSLSVFTFLTVASLFILRMRNNSEPIFKTWGYPITPIIFLLLNGFTIYFVLVNKTEESLWGLLNLVIGGIIYFTATVFTKKNNSIETTHSL